MDVIVTAGGIPRPNEPLYPYTQGESKALLEIAGKPIWWILLLFIPVVNLVISILVCIAVAQKFGKSSGFGVGLALLGFVFYPILGFGDAKYQGGAQPPPMS